MQAAMTEYYRLGDLTKIYLSRSWRVGSVRLRHLQIWWCLVRAFFLVSRRPSLCTLKWQKASKRALWGVLYKYDNPLHGVWMIKLPPKHPTSWHHHIGVRISAYKFEDNTNIQCMTVPLPHLVTECMITLLRSSMALFYIFKNL